MADAAAVSAPSRFAMDRLFRRLQAAWNLYIGDDAPKLRTKQLNRFLGNPLIGDGATAGKIALGNPNYRNSSTGNLANGTTNGKLKTVATTAGDKLYYSIAGQAFEKGATDDLFDLSALGTTDGTHFKAVALYLDGSGTASVGAGTAALSAAAAIAALPRTPFTKACVGVFVMGVSGNFANALSAQGTLYNGFAPLQLQLHSPDTYGYTLGGRSYSIEPQDDFWNLSGETDTIANQYRGYRLYADGTFLATANVVNAVAATAQASVRTLLAALADDRTKTVVAEIICGPSTDFSANAILAKTGALTYNGYSSDQDLTGYEVNWGN